MRPPAAHAPAAVETTPLQSTVAMPARDRAEAAAAPPARHGVEGSSAAVRPGTDPSRRGAEGAIGANAPSGGAGARTLTGGLSMARQLGLGVSRIVIDPGHGGHDPGAQGKGVSEAELVLDVALRLEKLLQQVPGHGSDAHAAHRRVRPAAGADGDRQPRRRRSLSVDSRQRQRQRPGARGRDLLPQFREQP